MNDTAKHIGIILDGNRRWAKTNGKSKLEGYRAGFLALKNLGPKIKELGIETLSVYTFSAENWQRSSSEISMFMKFAKKVAMDEVEELNKEGIRIRFLGRRIDEEDKSLQALLDEAERLTRDNTEATLAICFNYGGQQEIVDAVKKAQSSGKPVETVEDITSNLYAADISPPNLIIRTGGDKRLSNFMLWRAAYTELLFIDKFWPDFTPEDLELAVEEFKDRKRTFGK